VTSRRTSLGRFIALVTAWVRQGWDREDVPNSPRVAPPDEPSRPAVPAAYMPLYTYLDRRYADRVVLTFEQIESLLGFAPPPACADAEWWTGPCGPNDLHTAAWTAARRTAVPQLSARIVVFERLS